MIDKIKMIGFCVLSGPACLKLSQYVLTAAKAKNNVTAENVNFAAGYASSAKGRNKSTDPGGYRKSITGPLAKSGEYRSVRPSKRESPDE